MSATSNRDLERVRVVAVSGSLRRFSYNRALLHAAAGLAPPGMEVKLFDLSHLPLYNQDLEAQGPPDAVKVWTDAVAGADALLIATPEYNFSTSAAIKNAIEWASRPHRGSPLDGKPVAIMGATPGKSGTARAQAGLRQMLSEPGALLVTEPEVLVGGVRHKFDEKGELADRETRMQIRALLDSLQNAVAQARETAGDRSSLPAAI